MLSEKRFQATPNIPSAPEAGLPGVNASVWTGLFAPAKTPKTILARLSRDVTEVLQLADVKAALVARDGEASPSTPEAFRAFLAQEVEKWAKVIRGAGIADK